RNHLKEIAANLFGGPVDAGDGKAGDGRRFLGDEDFLDLLRRFQFEFHPGLMLAFKELLAGDGEDEGEEEERVEDECDAEEVAAGVEAYVVEAGSQSPVREANALPEQINEAVEQGTGASRGDERPQSELFSASEAVADNHKYVERRDGVDGGGDGVNPGQGRPRFVPDKDGPDIAELRREIDSDQPFGSTHPTAVLRQPEKIEQDHPDGNVLSTLPHLGDELGGAEGQGKAVGGKVSHSKKATCDEIKSKPGIHRLFPITKIEQKTQKARDQYDSRDEQIGQA